MGKAILHIHSRFSDGLATVDEILDEVEGNSSVDIVGFTDHDDVRSYRAAINWKERHPESRVQPLWGVELTTWAFKHVLVYIFQPPFPTQTFPKFLPLRRAIQAGKSAGGYIVVPHVDAFWIGVGRRRLARQFAHLGVDAIELLTPVLRSRHSIDRLAESNGRSKLLELGGSDAHHLEDLYRVVVEFPGRTVSDFERALHERTTQVRWGTEGPRVPLPRQLRQHTRALVVHPAQQVQRWTARQATRCWSAILPTASPAEGA